MDLWMEIFLGVGGSWDRRGIFVCFLLLSLVRGLMIFTLIVNLWYLGWLIINKLCWWKFCKCLVIVWYIYIICEDILRIELLVIFRINILLNYIGLWFWK